MSEKRKTEDANKSPIYVNLLRRNFVQSFSLTLSLPVSFACTFCTSRVISLFYYTLVLMSPTAYPFPFTSSLLLFFFVVFCFISFRRRHSLPSTSMHRSTSYSQINLAEAKVYIKPKIKSTHTRSTN